MIAKLYAIPMSHPVMAAQLMLEYKGIEHERVELMPGLHRLTMKLLGFREATVPGLVIGGGRVQGTRDIARELDRIRPNPALLPADASTRAEVERVERWGEEVLQEFARRTAVCVLRHAGWPAVSFAYGATLNRRLALALKRPAGLGVAIGAMYGARDAVIRADLLALPRVLDAIDGWIDAGVLNGDRLNAADFQIAPSIQLLLASDDFARVFEGRPVESFARRVAPAYPYHVGPVLPAHWLEPLRANAQIGPGAKLNA